MRIRSTLVALLLTTGLAHAQNVSPLGGSTNNAGSAPPALGTTAAPATVAPVAGAPAASAPAPSAAPSTHAHHTFAERFAAANTTHDGKLTLEQAKAGHLRAVARDFGKIDKSKRGYVTLDEVKAYQTEQRAARRAARDAKKPAQ